MATVLYARVSTTDQTLEHQRTQGSTSSDLGTVLSGGFSRFVDIEKTHRLDRGGLTVSRDRGADYGSTVTRVDQGHQSREPLAGLEVIREHSPVLEIAR